MSIGAWAVRSEGRGSRPAGRPTPERTAVMKQYLLAVHMVEGEEPQSEDETQQAYKDVDAPNPHTHPHPPPPSPPPLHPPPPATPVRARADDPLPIAGPPAEAKEQLGGFWVIRA